MFSDFFWPISAISMVFLSINTFISIFWLLVQHVSTFQKCKNLFCVSCGCITTIWNCFWFFWPISAISMVICPSRPYFWSSFRLCSMWVHFKNANTCSVCHVSASQPSVMFSDCFWPISAISRVFLSIKTLLSTFFLLVQHVSAFQKCKHLFCVSCECIVTILHMQVFNWLFFIILSFWLWALWD